VSDQNLAHNERKTRFNYVLALQRFSLADHFGVVLAALWFASCYLLMASVVFTRHTCSTSLCTHNTSLGMLRTIRVKLFSQCFF